MNILKRFGNSSNLYTFPTNAQVSYTDNFASLVTKTVRLAGVNGGFSNLGTGRGLSPIGTVRADIWLTFNSIVEATDKVNSLRQMADWGLQPLWRQPLYGVEQFCLARITDIQLSQDVKNVPHQRLKVPVIFEVPDPFWHTSGTELLWGSGWKWGDGSKWGGSTPAATNVTSAGTITLTVGGNQFTFGRVQIVNTSGANVSSIIIRRMANGIVADEMRWSGTLADSEQLSIDPRRQLVRRGPLGGNVISFFSASTPDWLRLYPGTNTIQVFMDGTAAVSVRWLERYV